MNSFEELLDASKDIMEAYEKMNSKSTYMHPDVKHTITEDPEVTAHHFASSQDNLEKVHGHLVSQGFKQAGASTVAHGGGSVETRYVHPKTKKVAYVGHRSKTETGWLDIQK